MTELVVFRLEAPMAAFGDLAPGERRGSHQRPSHSALVGLIAGALGYGREDPALAQLTAGILLAVRTDHVGAPLADFHTAQTPPQRKGRHFATRRAELADKDDLGTIVSRRDYWTDMAFTIVVWPTAALPWPAQSIADALNRPVFTPFAGRRSCPVGAPFCATVLRAGSLVDALSAYEAWLDEHRPDVFVSSPRGCEIAYDARLPVEATIGLTILRPEVRRDSRVSHQPWQFDLRSETVAEIGGLDRLGGAT
ncbi:type I-E CRISPR-associated protein Cas5/CasD [Oryzibacter oryziterrae]|uniref:type I-E CRISPR-associated protein Cas5/CasD n=1 Tax=Oryzibacter oryziterrae TaxID=2766474 RepID=UPI001EFFDE66|nr:type I-E CRISPR-associated protein Cas5/CasD [Oryzibacter oryziterrae]